MSTTAYMNQNANKNRPPVQMGPPPVPMNNIQPPQPQQIQKMLEDNNHLIQTLVDCQNKGKPQDIFHYLTLLRKNLEYMFCVTDNTANIQSFLPPPTNFHSNQQPQTAPNQGVPNGIHHPPPNHQPPALPMNSPIPQTNSQQQNLQPPTNPHLPPQMQPPHPQIQQPPNQSQMHNQPTTNQQNQFTPPINQPTSQQQTQNHQQIPHLQQNSPHQSMPPVSQSSNTQQSNQAPQQTSTANQSPNPSTTPNQQQQNNSQYSLMPPPPPPRPALSPAQSTYGQPNYNASQPYGQAAHYNPQQYAQSAQQYAGFPGSPYNHPYRPNVPPYNNYDANNPNNSWQGDPNYGKMQNFNNQTPQMPGQQVNYKPSPNMPPNPQGYGPPPNSQQVPTQSVNQSPYNPNMPPNAQGYGPPPRNAAQNPYGGPPYGYEHPQVSGYGPPPTQGGQLPPNTGPPPQNYYPQYSYYQ